MKHSPSILLGAVLLSAPHASTAAKPEFVPLQVPPGKTAQDIKPRREVRVEDPVVLQLRGHRHEDGSLHFECDHSHTPSVEPKFAGDTP